jgi:hypothetical protein
MSKNVYGELYYGFPIDRDKDKYFNDNFEFKDEYKWMQDPLDWYYEFDISYKDKQNMPVSIDIAGSMYGGEPSYYVYIKESKKRSYYGEMIQVNNLDIDPDWGKCLDDFSCLLGLDKQEPGWYLTSLLG